MGKASKVLSIVLIIASLFGLVGGALSLKDALGSKAYWESAGGGDSIGMLEDGLNQLKENEAAYLAGRDTLNEGKAAYAEGVKALEEGQKQYDEGMKTLEEKQAEYDAGVKALKEAEEQLREGRHKLYDGEKQYAEGEAALEQAKALQSGLGQINSGFGTWKQGYAGLKALQDALGLPAPAASNAAVYDQAIAGALQQISDGFGTIAETEGNLNALNASLAELKNLVAQRDQLTAGIAATEAAGGDTTELNAKLAAVNGGIAQYEAGIAPKVVGLGFNSFDASQADALQQAIDYAMKQCADTRQSLTETKAKIEPAVGVPQAVANGQAQLAGGVATAVNGVLGNEEMAGKLTGASGMSADALKSVVSSLGSMDYATFEATMTQLNAAAQGLMPELGKKIDDGEKALADAKSQLGKGHLAYNTGREQYEEGKKQLEEGAVLLEEGKAKLEEAAKQLEEGKAQLTDAEKQISDGEAQLAVFEDGRDQVIAGLETAIATEAAPGTRSIADRLGEGFSFMKNETDLDIDKGLEVVAAARDYAAETTGAVTKEILNKVIGSVVALVGSALALLGGILGVPAKKPKLSGAVGLIGGIAAIAGAILSVTSGSFFSQAAGASGPALLVAAEAVTAVVAVPQAITSFAAKAKTAI